MRISAFSFAIIFAVTATFATAPAAVAEDDVVALEGADWRADLNKKVSERNHWRWTLRRVERVGDKLSVSVRFRNNASTGRPIFLEDQFLTTIALIDDQTQDEFELLEVDGISGDITAVDRKKSKSAVFTFVYPEGASSVTFTSRWISMRMGGEATVMDVDFPIEIPPAGANPS